MTELERLQKIIYRARWIDGIKDASMITDEALAKAVLEGGFAHVERE